MKLDAKKIPYIRIWARLFDFKSKSSLKTHSVDLLTLFCVTPFMGFVMAFEDTPFFALAVIFPFLYFCLPMPSLFVRRLRDAGYSPYWGLLLLVPLYGLIVLIILSAIPNAEGENERAVIKKRRRNLVLSFIGAVALPLVPPAFFISLLLLGVLLDGACLIGVCLVL